MAIKNRLKWQIKRYSDIFKTTKKMQNKKKHTLYIKTQHKKNQTKQKKMLTRRVRYVIILLLQGEKTKIEIKI